MEVKQTGIKDLIEIQPKLFGDERGYFVESFKKNIFDSILPGVEFVQDNQSYSDKNVLRGLHFQKEPYAQGKLVRAVTGRVLDVVVDLRPDSATFGNVKKFLLESKLQNMVYVPEGFAHGFLTLEPSIFVYKVTNYYDKESESGIIWNDEELNVDWGVKKPIVSEKDHTLHTFKYIKDSLVNA